MYKTIGSTPHFEDSDVDGIIDEVLAMLQVTLIKC